ncbi:hypothetical protein PWT90_03438 [Aphanocladium album]|nr:hypothetical protein PWT90_03438 [Aphanocladium album]
MRLERKRAISQPAARKAKRRELRQHMHASDTPPNSFEGDVSESQYGAADTVDATNEFAEETSQANFHWARFAATPEEGYQLLPGTSDTDDDNRLNSGTEHCVTQENEETTADLLQLHTQATDSYAITPELQKHAIHTSPFFAAQSPTCVVGYTVIQSTYKEISWTPREFFMGLTLESFTDDVPLVLSPESEGFIFRLTGPGVNLCLKVHRENSHEFDRAQQIMNSCILSPPVQRQHMEYSLAIEEWRKEFGRHDTSRQNEPWTQQQQSGRADLQYYPAGPSNPEASWTRTGSIPVPEPQNYAQHFQPSQPSQFYQSTPCQQVPVSGVGQLPYPAQAPYPQPPPATHAEGADGTHKYDTHAI